MDRLWAPWRLSYVSAGKPPTDHDPCFICQGLVEKDDRGNLLAWRGLGCAVYLNKFPYNNGHLLVAPNAHKGQLHELESAEVIEIQQTITRMVAVVRDIIKPDGFNIGLNIGRAAGAGLPGHLHWHIVPRWIGDANFMPTVSDTRVIVQSLDQFYTTLTERMVQTS